MSGQKMSEAELKAILERIWGPPPPKPKPKVVTNEGKEIRDAVVKVSPADPNYREADDGVVKVRRKDWVTVRLDLYEEQMRERREDRRRRRELDPFRLGLYGPVDEGE